MIVRARGQVHHSVLNPRAHRILSTSELAGSIMEQIGRVTAAASQQEKQLMEPQMSGDLPYEEIFDANVSLDSFLSQPAELYGEPQDQA